MNTLPTLRRHALALLAVIALGDTALAQPYAPTVSEVVNGSYTVSYDPDCYAHMPYDVYCEFLYLVEQDASGVWNVVAWDAGSVSFTSKPPGTYTYFLWVGASHYWYGYNEGIGEAITVTVPAGPTVAPVRDDILTQLGYLYDVRRGDSNGDGRTDLFVRKTAGGTPLNGTVQDVLLRQQVYSPGRFDAVVPTAGEAAYMSAWPPAPTIEARPHDIDVDGYVDVALANVGSVIVGAPDQIVYSPGQLGVAEPGGVRAVDWRLASFVGDAMDYFADADYFLKNATYYYYMVSVWYAYCPWLDYGGLDAYYSYYWSAFTYCYYDHYYYFGIYTDFSAFSPDAVQLWTYDYYGENGLISKEDATAMIEAIVESVIGAPLGGWPMEELLGQVGPHVEQLIRRGLEAYQSILNTARAVPEHVDMDNLPPQTPRMRDVIYVTGHQLFRDWGHLALEYASPQEVGGLYMPTTLSGQAENWPPIACFPWMNSPLCGWGKLLAVTNKTSDHWYNNFLVGQLIPFIGAPGTYWNNSLVPRHNRFVSVPYALKPDYNALPDAASNTYNSNGYARGLNGQGGYFVVPADMNSVYPGWNRPVPEHLFQ